MLRAYGPGCDGSIIDPKVERIPDHATWIDLEEPTTEEEKLVERCIGLNVPTQQEMAEIEPSSRLYERDGVLYMTVSVLFGVVDGEPSTTPIGFVLAKDRLVTIRYATPKPVLSFSDHVRREPDLARDATTVLVRLLDASLGLISIEQNAAMKLFSWAAVVFLPPTLIAGVFGMNFHYMPELDWRWGYPASLALMLASMVLPYLYFKRRGWI